MVIHKCERCKTIWTKKSNFLNHLKRKNKCHIVGEIEEVKGDNDEFLIGETKPKIIAINGKHYYNADDLKNYDPAYFKSCSNSRKILEKVVIPEDKYIFASHIDGSWEIKDETYKRAKLLIRKKFVLGNVPKMIPNLEKDKVRKMYDVEVAPDVMDLDDDEKFKDVDGNIIEIEVRGERSYDKCYFKVYDIKIGFGIKKVSTRLTDKDCGYIENFHYKYFNIEKKKFTQNIITKMYLTFYGLKKFLSTSRKCLSNDMRNKMIKWLYQTFDNNRTLRNITIDVPKNKKLSEQGYVYCIDSPSINYIKIGFWRGTKSTLRSRYVTYYGNDVSVYVFKSQNARNLEKKCHNAFKKYQYSNELFLKEHLPEYLDFLTENEIQIDGIIQDFVFRIT
jgi:hypothetical protein